MKTSYINCTSPNCRMTFRSLGSLKKHLSKDHCKMKKIKSQDYQCHKAKGIKQCCKEQLCTIADIKLLEHQDHDCEKIPRLDDNFNSHKIADSELDKKFKKKSWELSFDSETQDMGSQLPKEEQAHSLILLKLPEIIKPQSGIKLPSIFD